jgi:uncharacterized phage infection (PIP) family protein YhgE
MAMKKKQSEQDSSIASVAGELEADVASFESLTARISRMELGTEKDILRAAELLNEAANSHKRFLEHLRDLIVHIDGVRGRQNASAAALSDAATKLDARRQTYVDLQQRFAALGAVAQEVNELVRQSADTERDTPEARQASVDGLRAAQERLHTAIDAARSLVADARAAQLGELERQADALRQQLSSLANKLSRVESALGPESPKA